MKGYAIGLHPSDGDAVPEAIRTEKLTKDFNGFRALESLDLKVGSGHVVGFLGPNGAGKTTTIKILTRLLRPTAGGAFLWGIDVAEDPRRAMERVGAVVETPELYPELTPREILSYVGKLRNMSPAEIKGRTKAVLEEVKMTEWMDQRTGKFSKGMKQRVAIAQALMDRPDLLILDEPTSGLDPRGMAEVRDVIKGLSRHGTTVFMSSHLLYEVQEICDWAALVNKGKLLMYDELAKLTLWRKGGRVEVEILPPIPAEALERVRGLGGVKSVRGPDGNRVVVELDGGDDERAALLRSLIGWGLRVRSFKDAEMPLESLYLELIKESR